MLDYYFKKTTIGTNWTEVTIRMFSPTVPTDREETGTEARLSIAKFILGGAYGLCLEHSLPQVAQKLKKLAVRLGALRIEKPS